MAKMFPVNPQFKGNFGEKKVYDYLKANLREGEVCYYNYKIGLNEFDFCIMIPNRGILIIEVKSWLANNVIDIIDNLFVKYNSREGTKFLQSPYKQAMGYARVMINELRKRIRKEILVLPLVWYTDISRKEYEQKRLDILSDKRFTFFKEDLEHRDSFSEKINGLFQFAIKYYRKIPDVFDRKTFEKSRELFQSIEQIKKEYVPIRAVIAKRKCNRKQYYSIFRYVPKADEGQVYEHIIEKDLEYWSNGTKLILLTGDEKFMHLLENQLLEKLRDLNIEDKFCIKSENKKRVSTYNLNCYFLKTQKEQEILIYDGNSSLLKSFEKDLKDFDSVSGFNINQYIIEHCQTDKDVVVKAGAGTGKTHTMISRIMFLIHFKRLNYNTLMESIIMITFTNEAADQMKRKIKEEIQDYYLLTGDLDYFEMITTIDDMNISTIHSLILKILQGYSDIIGYGKDLAIVTGISERKLEIERVLNNAIKKIGAETQKITDIMDDFDLTLYHFKKLIESLFKKLENKNIDILNTSIDFGDSNHMDFNNMLKNTIIEVEKNIREQLKKNNTIKLSHLIIELGLLYNKLVDIEADNPKVQYLFIDEFQDTDNVQIDLISMFKKLFKFNLFIVGDIKQCIYRFRGAEENAFERLIGENKGWQEYELVKNYRTDKRLLDIYHGFFENWGEKSRLPYDGKGDKLVSDMELNCPENEHFKKIKMSNYNEKEFEKKFIEELKLQLEYLKKEDDENKAGEDKDKEDGNGEIAILVRENKEVERIVNIGQKYNIAIDNNNIGGLYKIEPTLDFYKLILALQNNKSPKHLISLFDTNYIKENIDIRGLIANKRNNTELYKFIIENWPIRNWKNYIEALKKDTVLKVLRDIVKDLRPWDIYGSKHENFEKRQWYYKGNLDLVFEKLSQRKKTDYLTLNKIEEFLKIMITTGQQEEVRIKLSEVMDKRIICSTVHKAKGLEFDMVILPYTNLDVSGTRKGGEYDFLILEEDESPTVKVGYRIRRFHGAGTIKTNNYYSTEGQKEREYRLNEERRILYVALTRAKKKLVCFQYGDNQKEETWQNYLK